MCDLSYKYAQTILNILICLTKHGAQLPNARHTHIQKVATRSFCELDIHFLHLELIVVLNGLFTSHSQKLVKSETLADQQNWSKNHLLIYVTQPNYLNPPYPDI